jgi:microtubule-associated protein, RP/EB family
MDESIGMMSEAYFASRTTILQWLNSLLGLEYTKIEETASGIAACQIFDALYPGMVKLEKANFAAKRDYEYVTNYKVLQAAFTRAGITKDVDVERLIKGKYQDNLEFMQWVKGFFDGHASEDALIYDGAARRAGLGKVERRSTVSAPPRRTLTTKAQQASARFSAVSRRRADGNASKENIAVVMQASPVVKKSQYDALQSQIDELNQTIDDGESERLFYFEKLREIEVIVQALEDQCVEDGTTLNPPMSEIKAILYRTDGEECDVQDFDESELAADAGYEEEGQEIAYGLPQVDVACSS